MNRRAYVSHSVDAGGMLAVWLDKRPSCTKDQRDPDAWVSGVPGTRYEAERLAELAKAPGAEIVVLHGGAAEWWHRIDGNRRRALSRERNARARDVQVAIPIAPEIEDQGRAAAALRSQERGR